MIAYNKTGLDNLAIQRAVQQAADNNCISREEQDTVKKQYPTGFYTPNIFIRIALFLATSVIASFTLGFFSLILLAGNGGADAFGVLSVFFGFLTYAALEFFVGRKKQYKSGVDDALGWISASFFVSGVNMVGNISLLGNAILILLIAGFFLVRFPNRLVSIVAVLALLAVVFLGAAKLGPMAKAITPFLLMLVTALVYIVAKHQLNNNNWKYYTRCMTIITVTALVCFYFCANYFIVREASNEMFDLHLQDGQSIPYGWVFWMFTILIPLFYIFRGIQKKDIILLRTGLLLVAFTVFTVRYYYAVMPPEMVMVLAGSILIGLAYTFMQYLKQPKHGFTYLPVATDNVMDKVNIEALVIAQTFAAQVPVANTTSFGGGSGGGAGASGEF